MWKVGDIVYRVGIISLTIIPYRVLSTNLEQNNITYLKLEDCFTGAKIDTYLNSNKSDNDKGVCYYTIDINRAYKWLEKHTK